MKRFKNICKRGVAVLLAAFFLVFVPVSDYQSATMTCYAAETSIYYALRALVEAMTLSMGYSFQTQQDLEVSTQGLENIIESYKDCDDLSDAVCLTALYRMLEGKSIGDTIQTAWDESAISEDIELRQRALSWLRDYIAGLNKRSGGSYDSSKDFGADRSQIVFADIDINTFKSCLYNLQTDCVPEANMLEGGFLACTVPRTDLPGYYKYWYVYCADYGIDFLSPDCPYILTKEKHGDYFYLCCRTKDGGYGSGFRIYSYCQETPNSKVVKSDYYSTTMQLSFSGAYALDTIYTRQRIYNSYSDYQIYAQIILQYAPENTMLGDATKSTALPESITITQNPTKTQEVEAAVTKAKEENPAITQDDLDAAVAEIIAKTTTTDTSSDSTTTDSAALADIFVSLNSIRDLISAFQKVWTDGSSALQQDVEDVRDNFEVIEGGGNQDSEPVNEEPKVWVPTLFFASRLLKPVMEYFGNPLSEITKFLNKIMNSVNRLPELFDESGKLYIGHIYSDMSSIVSYVGAISQAIKNLPKSVADALEIPMITPQEIVEALNEGLVFPTIPVEIPDINIPAIEIPEINIPEIKVPDVNIDFPALPDFMSVLNDILSAIQNLFVIDTAAVALSMNKLTGIWDTHLPFIPKIKKIVTSVSFSDCYDYPVIKIGTPNVLQPYYDSDFIVLLDFKNYAQYFLWARLLVRCMLWIGFFYSILRHFRVRFHIG